MKPLTLLLIAAWLTCLHGADSPAPLRKARLNIIASDSLFAAVNPSDAVAAIRIWVEQIAKGRRFQLDSKVEVVHSTAQIRQSLKDRSVDLLVLDTPNFLPLSEAGLVEVVAASTNQGHVAAYQYLLLTRDGEEAGQFLHLRGKPIAIASRTKANAGLVWLETVLADGKLGRAASFFSHVETNQRASSCVLTLFFGKIDACVVDAGNWDTIRELNPQLGRLKVAARSEALLECAIAMPIEPHPYRSEVIDAVLNLHKTPAGEQLTVMFKSGPVIRIGTEAFEPMRALYRKYQQIVDSSGVTPISTAGGLDETAGKDSRPTLNQGRH